MLLLLPFASALSASAQEAVPSTVAKQPRDPAKLDANPSPIVDINKGKYEVGTKDAPVDGKDGKPHAGPFVGTEKDQKPKTGVEKPETVLAVGKDDTAELVPPPDGKTPVPDGVMDDPNRQLPKVGTTGTEGGVSEKDKARKAQEGQTGEKAEKRPDSPKEAPPLPLSEETKIKVEKVKGKDDDHDVDGDEVEGLAGLEA